MATREQLTQLFQQLSSTVDAGINADNFGAIMVITKNFVGELLTSALAVSDQLADQDKELKEAQQTIRDVELNARQKDAINDGHLRTVDSRLADHSDQLTQITNKVQEEQNKLANVVTGLAQLETNINTSDHDVKGKLAEVTAALQTIKASGGQPGLNDSGWRGIMDFKAISNLIPLKSKAEFRLWNDRLISALDQAKPGIRKLLDDNIRNVDLGNPRDSISDWDKKAPPQLQYDKLKS